MVHAFSKIKCKISSAESWYFDIVFNPNLDNLYLALMYVNVILVNDTRLRTAEKLL